MSTIESLNISNFQRVSAIKIEPTNNIIALFGKNANGKTSVLEAVETTLRPFNGRVTKRPIKDGAGRADIHIKLTDGTLLHQKFTPSGPTLAGKGPDGSKLGQKDLDAAISALGVDALAFIHAGEKKQLETLLSIVDLPFVPAELDAKRKAVEAERLSVGQQGKAIGDVVVDASLPTEETSAGEIIAAIRAAEEAEREVLAAENSARIAAGNVSDLKTKISALTAELADWENELKERSAALDVLQSPADPAPLEAKLAVVEESNAAIRANNTARAQSARQDELRAKYTELTEQIKAIDKTKADGLAKAIMPIEGLDFDSEGVLYQGIPFSRASGAEQVIVSLAMLIATNPEIRVAIIRNGNVLDAGSLQVIQDMCEATNFQVFIEFVSDSEDHEFLIVDGELAS
jgi:energy-coupling factor transporter ATP-binding protein EcfA2